MFAMSVTTSGILVSMLVALSACTQSDLPSSSSSFFPIHVTIFSSNGTDLTPSIPVLHSHIPSSTVQQRFYISRPIRDCPESDVYTDSWCQRQVSPQDFQTDCKAPLQEGQGRPESHNVEGRCGADEICVGSTSRQQEGLFQAYCVSTDHFVRIGQDPPRGWESTHSTGVVTAGFHRALHNYDMAVEAVVTSTNNRASLFAASLVIQAQALDGVWRTVAKGTNDCLTCSSVVLAPFPVTAQRVKVDAVMPEGTPIGLLWLASYVY